MSMISELVKGLRKLGKQWEHNDVAGCNLIFDAADTIEILSTKLSKHNLGYGEWIPVSERLPEKYDQYLCYCDGGEFYVYWLENKPWVERFLEDELIIAWMPLPEPYREDGEE